MALNNTKHRDARSHHKAGRVMVVLCYKYLVHTLVVDADDIACKLLQFYRSSSDWCGYIIDVSSAYVIPSR